MVKGKYVGRFGVLFGANLRAFSVGFSIDRYSASIDFGFVWIAVEW